MATLYLLDGTYFKVFPQEGKCWTHREWRQLLDCEKVEIFPTPPGRFGRFIIVPQDNWWDGEAGRTIRNKLASRYKQKGYHGDGFFCHALLLGVDETWADAEVLEFPSGRAPDL